MTTRRADSFPGYVQSRPMPIADHDRAALVLLRTRGHQPSVERLVAAYSRLGEHGGCWLALGGAGAAIERDPDRRRCWRRGVRIVAAAYVLNQAVKFAIRRRRPELPELPPLTPTVSRLSFPSAHATTSFAAARAFSGLVPAGILYAAAGAFGLSRPYLGVHYPTDVLAGALLGTVVAELWPRGPQA
jgi:membrane-associated phospholipid phosphatase